MHPDRVSKIRESRIQVNRILFLISEKPPSLITAHQARYIHTEK
jgi:hypothetical protein